MGEDGPAGHHAYVAGRYRSGLLSDHWTDVLRCAERTFLRFVPACECGWVGVDHPATIDGYRQCCVAGANQHLRDTVPREPALDIHSDHRRALGVTSR